MTHFLTGGLAVFIVSLTLTACEDSSSPVETDPDTTGTAADSYDDQIIESLDLSFAADDLSATPADQIPTTGSAIYSGVVGFNYDTAAASVADYDVMADIALQADFATAGMTGQLDNFNTRADEDLDGDLTLTEGTITATGFTANAIGTFSDGTDAETWDLDVAADFMGAGGTMLIGTANGTTGNGGSESQDVFGDLAAAQD